jgi:hypothetical protein
MALSGSYGDLYIRQYKDLIEHELQQKGSVLRGAVTIESVMGERTYFPKLGKSTSYEVTGRSQEVDVQDQTYERRFISPRSLEAVHRIELVDMERYARSPQPELVESLALELGRQVDVNIITAMAGSAARELDGSSSSATFDTTNNQITVATNTFAGETLAGDTGLHEGKLAKALQILQTRFALSPGDEIFCVAPAIQLAGLRHRVLVANGAGWFQKNLPDVNNPFLDSSLDGFMGIRFIQHEGLGVDGSSDQNVYVFVRKAMKLGIFTDLSVRVDELPQKKGTPTQIKAGITLGSVRMWEEGIVRILCDPTPLYATA